MMREIISSEGSTFFVCLIAILFHRNRSNKRLVLTLPNKRKKRSQLWKNFAENIPSLFYDGQWFIMRFKMCLLPLPRKRRNTKGISISPIFSHPVYCTFDRIKFLFHFYFSHCTQKHIIYVPNHKSLFLHGHMREPKNGS